MNNANKNIGLNTNNINKYNGLINNDFLSKAQNKVKNYQSNKVLRKSDYHKVSNKNVLLDGNNLNEDMIINNVYQQRPVDRNSLLIKGKNKNSYKNIHNYLKNLVTVNEGQMNNKNIYINNEEMILDNKKLNTYQTKNLVNGYKNDNIYAYQGQKYGFNYLNKNDYI